MKNYILLLFMAVNIAFTVKSQNQINVNGAATTMSVYLGAYGPNIFLKVPIRNLSSIFPLVDSVGRLQVKPSDSTLSMHNGKQFNEIPNLPKVNSLISSAVSGYLLATTAAATYLTPSALSGYLSGYLTATAAAATYQDKLTLTTTGTGAASLSGNTLNIPQSPQAINMTAGRGISITGTYPNLTIALVTPTIGIVTRTLNSNFTPNSTKEVFAVYTITCSVTNPLLAGTSSASAFLEYSTDGGTTWKLSAQQQNSSGVGVAVAVQLINAQTGIIAGYIPANALARIRTTTTGTATVTYVTGQETYY